jgi:hypothetical protein
LDPGIRIEPILGIQKKGICRIRLVADLYYQIFGAGLYQGNLSGIIYTLLTVCAFVTEFVPLVPISDNLDRPVRHQLGE